MEIRVELHGVPVLGVEVTDAELDLACIESLLHLVGELLSMAPNSALGRLRAGARGEAALHEGR